MFLNQIISSVFIDRLLGQINYQVIAKDQKIKNKILCTYKRTKKKKIISQVQCLPSFYKFFDAILVLFFFFFQKNIVRQFSTDCPESTFCHLDCSVETRTNENLMEPSQKNMVGAGGFLILTKLRQGLFYNMQSCIVMTPLQFAKIDHFFS